MDATELHEKLLKTWLSAEEDQTLKAYGTSYFPTLKVGDVTLYTRPARTVVSGPAGGHMEVDGMRYIFVDDNGKWQWNFLDKSGDGQGFQGPFDFFLKKYDISDAEWLCDKTPAPSMG